MVLGRQVGWARHRARPALGLAVCLTLAVLSWPATPAAAGDDTGGYPNANMPCEWFPQATSGPAHTEWCQAFDWGPNPSEVFAGQETITETTTISPRGFGYRNCTDYVAVKLGFDAATVHGNAAQWKDQIPPANVSNYPTVGSVAWWGKEVDAGLGHVGLVLSLNPDGGAVIGEYNNYLDGTYDTRTIPIHGADAFLHIKDQALPGGVAWFPGYHPVLPTPSPTGLNPGPRPVPTPVRSVEAAPLRTVAPTPTPTPTPSPPPPDPKVLAAGALAGLGPSYVSFTPAGLMRPRAGQLVEARITRTDALAAALDQQLAPSRTAPLSGTDLMSATLEGPGFLIAATSPPQQSVVGSGPAVWQWRVTPLRRGAHTLTLCLSVDVNTDAGPQPSTATCVVQRTVSVTEVPFLASIGLGNGALAWMVAALVVVLGAGAVFMVRRRAGPRGV